MIPSFRCSCIAMNPPGSRTDSSKRASGPYPWSRWSGIARPGKLVMIVNGAISQRSSLRGALNNIWISRCGCLVDAIDPERAQAPGGGCAGRRTACCIEVDFLCRFEKFFLNHFCELCACRIDRLFASLRSKGQLLRPEKLHVRNAHESQQISKMRLLGIHRLCRTLAVETTAGLDDDGALALEQPHGAAFAVLKGDPCAQHVVKPSLQSRGDTEIVHRRADDEGFGSLKFGDELIRLRSSDGLRGISGFGSAQRVSGVDGQMGDRVAAQIARDNAEVGVLQNQLRDGILHKLV